MSVRISLCQCGISWLPTDGFSWNLICQYFSKVYRENSSFVEIWHEWLVHYMKTNKHFWSYLNHFFLESKMFRTKVVKKTKTHILCSITFFENCAVYEKTWKNILDPDSTQMTIGRMRITCSISTATNIHWGYVILIASALQQRLHERASMLRYTYTVCLDYSSSETAICWSSAFKSPSHYLP